MTNDCYRDILVAKGFKHIGSLNYDVRMEVWWLPEYRQQLVVVDVGPVTLMRTSRHYRLKAIGEKGESYTRDLAALDAHLTGSFDEVHMSLHSFRDPPESLARKRIQQKRFRHTQGDQDLKSQDLLGRATELSDEQVAAQESLEHDEKLLALNHGRSALLKRIVERRSGRTRQRCRQTQSQRKVLMERAAVQGRLEREYHRKGSVVCLLFTVSSAIQVARNASEFRNSVEAMIEELVNAHHYKVRQQLEGSRLQIYVEEIQSPGLTLLTRWTGSLLSPGQLERLGPEFTELRDALERHCEVFPRQDILLGGSVRDEKKLVAAHVVRNFLQRLDRVPSASRTGVKSPPGRMRLWIGNTADV